MMEQLAAVVPTWGGTLPTDYDTFITTLESTVNLMKTSTDPATQAQAAQMIADVMKQLYLILILAVIFIYLVMVAQFQSLLSPFIIMFTIPLAFTGGLFALYFTGNDQGT